jgi:hypothetical protein
VSGVENKKKKSLALAHKLTRLIGPWALVSYISSASVGFRRIFFFFFLCVYLVKE